MHGKGSLSGKSRWTANQPGQELQEVEPWIDARSYWSRSIGNYGSEQSSRAYNVPASTLKDRLSGNWSSSVTDYNNEENELLATFLVQVSQMGLGKSINGKC